MSCLEVCCLISKYLGTFWLSLSISTLIPLWSKSTHCVVSMILNVLRCVLWPRMWSVLVSVPCELEKNVYSALLDEVAYGYWLSSWLTMLLSSTVSLFIFCWTCPPLMGGINVSDYNTELLHLSLQFYQFLLHIFWHSVIRCIHIKVCLLRELTSLLLHNALLCNHSW